MQFECRMAGCSTQQDQRRRMLGCRDVVWCDVSATEHYASQYVCDDVTWRTFQRILTHFNEFNVWSKIREF